MQLEYVDIEWSSSFGGYSIKFKDANNKTYSFIMNNKYFPISLGQGLFAFEEEYRQKYEWQDTNIENNEESYFYGKVIESNAKYIIVEPNENEEERKSADKISVGLGENNDALYTIGTNVKITYDGTILESYPAQVKATKIEIKSAENFEILFKQLRDPASDILPALKNTIIFFVSNTLVMLPLCYFVSYFLYKKIFGFRVFRVVFFIPSILSAVVLVTVFKEMIKTDGPLSKMLLIFGYKMPSLLTSPLTAKWVIVAYTMWTGFGVNVILYQGAMSRIPDSVIEAGELDGVTSFGELFRIITPMMWPTLSTTIILSLTGIFTASGPILLFTEGKYDTFTISYWIYSQVTFSKSYEYPSATGLFFTAIGLPIVLTVRYFINKVYDDVEY